MYVKDCLALLISLMLLRAPTAGGQYHWVSMLAPRSSRKFFSYVTGSQPRSLFCRQSLTLCDRMAHLLGMANRYCLLGLLIRYARARLDSHDHTKL